MRVSGMDHIVLNCTDVEASLRFYTDVLGLAAERVDQWRDGKIRFPSVRISETTIIDLFPLEAGSARPGGLENLNHFCMYVEGELEPCIADLDRHGVVIETGPIQRWGARGTALSVYLRDPDGNLVELRSYVSVGAEARPVTASARS